MLLQDGYNFTRLVSHESLVEQRKADYYLALNKAQSSWKSKKEDISSWIGYFLEIIRRLATKALAITQGDQIEHMLSVIQQALWQWAQSITH